MVKTIKAIALSSAMLLGSAGVGAYAQSSGQPNASNQPASGATPTAPTMGGGRSVGAAPGTAVGGSTSSQSLGAAPGTSVGGSGISSGSLGAAPGTSIGGHR